MSGVNLPATHNPVASCKMKYLWNLDLCWGKNDLAIWGGKNKTLHDYLSLLQKHLFLNHISTILQATTNQPSSSKFHNSFLTSNNQPSVFNDQSFRISRLNSPPPKQLKSWMKTTPPLFVRQADRDAKWPWLPLLFPDTKKWGKPGRSDICWI